MGYGGDPAVPFSMVRGIATTDQGLIQLELAIIAYLPTSVSSVVCHIYTNWPICIAGSWGLAPALVLPRACVCT